MGFFPLPDITLKGTTPGSVTGESVELLPYFQLLNGEGLTFEVRVVATGFVYPSTMVVRSFVQRFSVRKVAGTTTIVASDTQDQFGDSGGASWTFAASVGTSPDRFKLTFTTGSTQSKTAITADILVTRAPDSFLLAIPPNPFQALRADDGVLVSGGFVTTWRDQTPNHYNDSPFNNIVLNASDSTLNNHPSLSPSSSFAQLSTGTISVSGTTWTGAVVISPTASFAGSATSYFEIFESLSPVYQSFGLTGTSSFSQAEIIKNGTTYNLGQVFTTPTIYLFTFDASSIVTGYENSATSFWTQNTSGAGSPFTAVVTTLISLQQCAIAEQVWWNRELSAAEISQYMNYGSGRYAIALH
jgi:hypothetical protein